MKRVCFDFDSTLSRPDIQEFAQEIINEGVECWICTTRYTSFFSEVHEVAEGLGIEKHHIIFTNMKDKVEFFRGKDDWFLWHLDDNFVELNQINKETNIVGISSLSGNWRQKCRKLL